MHVIGTAGHVDHGKSSLVKALTGTDPDRLKEEKERGLTIELGFALLPLPSGREASIVDVPGHERFIKTMLAGVGGIDAVLLAVAADEGIMPQTREHLEIINLIGIEHGVVALTKADLVEPELLEQAALEIAEALAPTSLAGAPVVPCSAQSGDGLGELLDTLDALLQTVPRRRDTGRPRLPLDRAFSARGFGTVVTGTLVDGSLRTGLEVELVPSPAGIRTVRIRGLETHGRSVRSVAPGTRVAANLAGLDVHEIRRGMVLTTPGWLAPTTAVDVRLRAVSYLPRPIRHNTVVSFHTGTAEAQGRLVLLDREELPPGEECWAQVRLAAPVAVVRGDAFVLRDPNQTVGGGRVVSAAARRHRRHDPSTIAALETALGGALPERILAATARREPASFAALADETGASPSEVASEARRMAGQGSLVVLGPGEAPDRAIVFTQAGFDRLTKKVLEAVSNYHRAFPLRRGLPVDELAARAGLPVFAADACLRAWVQRRALVLHGRQIAIPSHEPALDARAETQVRAFLADLRASRFAPSSAHVPDEETLAYLESRGDVVRAPGGVVFARDAWDEMVSRITSRIQAEGEVTLAAVRDMFGTSRKYAQAVLEQMDARRITRRVGEVHVLRSPGPS